MSLDELETMLCRFSDDELIYFLQEKQLLKSEMKCNTCLYLMKIKRSINYRENKCWRCNYPTCESKRGKKSIKSLSFLKILILISG